MIVTIWGARGSLASSGPDMTKYGGNTSCVEVRGADDMTIILDAGTGIRRLGLALDKKIRRVDILLTHLHLDHIQGLGFFKPLYDPDMEVHIYGAANSNRHLHTLLTKYLSPPLFPVLLNDLPCQLYLHRYPDKGFSIGKFHITAQMVIHPGLTFGYRISSQDGTLAYLPDHEPALGVPHFPLEKEWTSGFSIAENVDLLLHDAQYTLDEYKDHIGWGHSAIEHTLMFANLAKVKRLVTFHHDPSRNDEELDTMLATASRIIPHDFTVEPGLEGSQFLLPSGKNQ